MKGDIDNRPVEFGPDSMPRRKRVDVDAWKLDADLLNSQAAEIKKRVLAIKARDFFILVHARTPEYKKDLKHFLFRMTEKMSGYVLELQKPKPKRRARVYQATSGVLEIGDVKLTGFYP